MKQEIAITVDAVIFAEENNELFLLMIKRKNEPFKNEWALPGGFLEKDELLKTGCLRELKEETGLALTEIQQVGIYDKIDRDPRGRTLSVAFTAKLQQKKEVKGNDDAEEAEWVSLKEIKKTAFDHNLIISDAKKKLQITA
ncbi:NUDIX hydrolase [Mesonia maritima]|uniref:8-oxo-dGTP diphosphatase n=1 Tax=Mesonia maritima TaxID=1793873 RepID=A0ABU1KAR3_9FLAO|nr:NUDIX hydrolase [Mesonia maritima]MDR6302127.1 8-oxo-dGTP diphosphatase [Mesonia maritima]